MIENDYFKNQVFIHTEPNFIQNNFLNNVIIAFKQRIKYYTCIIHVIVFKFIKWNI